MKLDARLWQWARRQSFLLVLAVGSGLVGGGLTACLAWLLSQVVGRVFLSGSTLEGVIRELGWILGLILLRAGLVWGSEFSARRAAALVQADLRQSLFEHLVKLGPAFTRREQTGELTNTVIAGVDNLDAYFSQYLPQVALAALLPLAYFVLVFALDPLSSLVLLITAPLIPLFMVLIGSLGEALTRRQWGVLSVMSAFYLDLLQGLTTLKMLGRSQAQGANIRQVNDRYRQTTMRVLRVTFLSALVLELLSTLGTAVVAVEVGLRLLYGRLEFEQALFILLLAPEFYLPLRTLGLRFHAGMAGVAAARRIFSILDQPVPEGPHPGAPGNNVLVSETANLSAPPHIKFQDVAFTYPDGRPGLRGVSFSLPAGKITALVGSTGSGKSTAADLLLRFIQPQAGEIWVNDQTLSKCNLEHWRSQVAWVPQKPYLFYGTIEENIRLGGPQASFEQVVAASRAALADQFIQELPQAYQTWIGERGVRLSAGQAQRIALARAFLKNAPVVILDEATANLDPVDERYLGESIASLLKGRTVLLIAHRLTTLVSSDRVVVLDEGRVVEEGSPARLLAKAGLFYQLVQQYRRSIGTDIEVVVAADSEPLAPGGSPKITDHAPLPAVPHSPQTPASSLTVLRYLLGLLYPYRWQVLLSVGLGFVTILSGVGLMALSAYIISAAALAPSIAALQTAIVGVRFFGITRGLFRYLERLVSHEVTFRLLGELRLRFYQALEPLAPARLLRYQSGDLLNRIVQDINHLEEFYVRTLAPALVAILVGLVTGLYLAGYDWLLALAFWAGLVCVGILLPALVMNLGRRPGRRMLADRADLSSALVDGIQGMADVLSFDSGTRLAQSIRLKGHALLRLQTHLAAISALQSAAAGALASVGMWGVLILAIPLVAHGAIPGVLLATLVLAALTSFEAVQPLPQAAQGLEGNLEAGRRLLDIISGQPEVSDPGASQSLPERFRIEARGLCFVYPPFSPVGKPIAATMRFPSLPRWDLDQVSFSLPAGKWLGVVGANGAGKTTLVNLLLRFWEYQQGDLLLDGRSLRLFSQAQLHRCIGVVSQNPHFFNASLRENLLVARPEATLAELDNILERAHLAGWLAGLPRGYDTPLGALGAQLSGGERQRLAIARLLLKDPSFVILDEPTANLDVLTEGHMMQTLFELMQGRTALLITHRLVGLDRMDEILVLEAGWVAERGTHADLLRTNGLYRRMWEMQQGWLDNYLAEPPVFSEANRL